MEHGTWKDTGDEMEEKDSEPAYVWLQTLGKLLEQVAGMVEHLKSMYEQLKHFERVGEGEFEHMQGLTTRLETEKRDLNQEEETELIEVYKCRESKFTWKSLIALTFGDLETRTFMPQVTGQSMVLEMGMDARGGVENFGLKAGAMGETELTDLALSLENTQHARGMQVHMNSGIRVRRGNIL